MTNLSLLFHEHTVKFYQWNMPEIGPGRSHVTKTHTRLTRTPDSIVVASQELREGLSWAGKPWTRWSTHTITTLKCRETVDGQKRLNLWHRTTARRDGRQMSYVRVATANRQSMNRIEGLSSESAEITLDFIEEQIGYRYDGPWGDKAFRSMLPGINLWHEEHSLNAYDSDMSLLVEALRERTLEDFVRVHYGKTRYRKDLVRAVAKTTPSTINALTIFKGVTPIDWQIEGLRMNEGNSLPILSTINRESVRNFRRILRQMSDPRKRQFLHGLAQMTTRGDADEAYRYHVIDDVFRMLSPLHGRPAPITDAALRSRNFHELHNAIVPNRYNQTYVTPPPAEVKKIKATETTDAINALDMGKYHFECAVDTEQMYKWGNLMSNCISSYSSKAVSQKGVYIGLYEDTKLIGNIELDRVSLEKFELRQILGRFNQPLPDDIRETAVKALLSTGIINEANIDNAWGMPVVPVVFPPLQPYVDDVEINNINDYVANDVRPVQQAQAYPF